MDKSSGEVKKKLEYEKPTVKRFPLRPDEAVLGFCKSGSMSGSGGANSCPGIFCKTPGS